MSTRSAIIMKTDTGYAGIYCHFDGYLENNGDLLYHHYQDPEKVAALIALGDISSLDTTIKDTVAYARDRGETGTEATTGDTWEAVADGIGHNGYVYVFEGGKWHVNGEDLGEALKKLQP